MSDALIFGLALLVFLLFVVLLIAFRFPAVFEDLIASITQIEVGLTTGLKIKRAATEAHHAQKGKPKPPAGTPPPNATLRLLASPRRLLWVDDHPEGNRHEIAMFRSVGIQVELARSNSEAVNVARAAKPDLIISDIDRDTEGPKAGLALPDELRKAGVEADVLYYTGLATAKVTEFGASVTDNPSELLAVIAKRLVPSAR